MVQVHSHHHYCNPLICWDQRKRTCFVVVVVAASGSVHWDVFHMDMWRTCVEVGEEAEGLNRLACCCSVDTSASHSIVARLQSDFVVVVGKKNQSLLKGMMMMMHGMMMMG